MALANDSILQLNQMAKQREKEGHKVINATIGMMYDEDKKLPLSKSIRDLMASHNKDEDLVYPSVEGEREYLDSLSGWFLNGEVKPSFLATIGGTGAVALSFHSVSKMNSLLLLPSFDWPNYEGVASEFGLEYDHYSLFEGKGFGINSLRKLALDGAKSHDHIAIVVNDPCENPTGYCMKSGEWAELRELLNKKELNGKVSLILDLAYIDFAEASQKVHIISFLKDIPAGVMVYLCFSFSKTFSLYGLRIGALGVMNQEKEKETAEYLSLKAGARGLWSVSNHMAMNIVGDLLTDESYHDELVRETNMNRKLVKERSSLFLKEAKEAGLETYPYEAGFFISIPARNAKSVVEYLMKEDIYIVPNRDDCLRVAFSSISLKEVKGLAAKIKEAITHESVLL